MVGVVMGGGVVQRQSGGGLSDNCGWGPPVNNRIFGVVVGGLVRVLGCGGGWGSPGGGGGGSMGSGQITLF